MTLVHAATLGRTREIEEETGLTSKDLDLLRPGKPFHLTDDELHTQWTFYSFVFTLKHAANAIANAITIDYKHTESRFIRPEESDTYDAVPNLPKDTLPLSRGSRYGSHSSTSQRRPLQWRQEGDYREAVEGGDGAGVGGEDICGALIRGIRFRERSERGGVVLAVLIGVFRI
ncbi:MAG: hypothetical protein M1833_004669 [Piccolia ochrophora]|nr:MAG: hypothetical protein M1833_004669 [Piccolia ochrophora]